MQEVGILFDIGLTGLIVFHSATYMLSITVLAKLVREESRGTIFALNGLIGSIGVCIVQACGGYLYNGVSKSSPNWIIFILYSLLIVVIIIMYLMNKLKV